MKRLAMLMVILIVSACTPATQTDSVTQSMQQAMDAMDRRRAEREAPYWADIKLLTQQEAAFKVLLNKCNQENADFIASLSDKELSAYSAFLKANKGGSDADEELARRNLARLLSKSGKLGAWMQLDRDVTDLTAKRDAHKKKLDELGAENARIEQADRREEAMWNDAMNARQQFMMQQNLQGIEDQLFWMNFNHPGKY
jgi:hypothetical protein